MERQFSYRYDVVLARADCRGARYLLLDVHTQRTIRTYPSFVVARSDAEFLNRCDRVAAEAAGSGAATRARPFRAESLTSR
jgi:hypothetical protein